MRAFSRYYRRLLSEQEKNIYDALLAGAEQRQTEISAGSLNGCDVQRILSALKYDNPQLYDVDFFCSYLFWPDRSSFFPEYRMCASARKQCDARLECTLEPLIRQVVGMPVRSALLLVHDWLVRRCTYGPCPADPDAAHTILGPLLYRECVCEGYAMAFKYIADRMRIHCIVVMGEGIHPDGSSIGGHAWNLVHIEGQCYHVDVTFDHLFAGRYCSRAYYLLSTEQLLTDHSIDDLFPIPDCSVSGSILKTVGGTAELLDYLHQEYRAGATHSEVRLTKGFPWEKLNAMMHSRLTGRDFLWFRCIRSYCYKDNCKTLFVRWK